jgi:DNA-3-methyladenine glycosylase I
MKQRCPWAGTDPLCVAYHDTEWGTPVHDDRKLFEFLILEGAQAGPLCVNMSETPFPC